MCKILIGFEARRSNTVCDQNLIFILGSTGHANRAEYVASRHRG